MAEAIALLSAAERRALLDEYFPLLDEVAQVEATEPLDAERMQQLVERQGELIFGYQDGFPATPLSRCPTTGAVTAYGLDLFDLDGLCWNWNVALRSEHDLPPTHFAFTGAVRLGSPVTPAAFRCRPGPEVPYVLPRILRDDSVLAVVSSVQIGPHDGFLIAYFGDPLPIDLPRANDWGASSYFARTSDGWGERSTPEDPTELDFELERWIEAGKLHWIVPGDEALTLRTGVAECPYLDLPGRRTLTEIVDGVVVPDAPAE